MTTTGDTTGDSTGGATGAAAGGEPAGPWWSGFDLVNGVFKGGGARGAAYAGALRAVAERRRWFASVAGASAGAITAALIAAGLDPAEVEAATPLGLASVRRSVLRAVLGRTSALFANDGLAEWLETLLAGRTRPRRTATGRSGPVTFAELYELTGIGLYVLTMDLAGREPQIFHHRLTPNVSVASAVVASCAIPGAFAPGRAVVTDHATASVRELVDGGAWANFPWFVYRDLSFRTWLGLGESGPPGASDAAAAEEVARPTFGFVLDDQLVRPRRVVRAVLDDRAASSVSRRFDLGPAGTSGGVVPYLLSAVLGGDAVRLVLLLVVLLFGGVSVAATPVLARALVQWFGQSPVSVLTPFLAFLAVALLLVVIGLVVVGAVAVLAFGRVLADTVLPTAEAALSVATGVAPWVGAQPNTSGDRVITVPAIGLSTTKFRVDDALRRTVVEHAYTDCLAQLDGVPAPPPTALGPDAGATARRLPVASRRAVLQDLLVRLVRTLLVTVVALRLLVLAVSDLEAAHVARGLGWLVASVVGLTVIAALTARRARFRAEHALARRRADEGLQRRWGEALAIIGVACVIASLVLVVTRFHHNEEGVVNARIVAAQIADDGRHLFAFSGTVRGGALTGEAQTGTFASGTDYRLGERLFVFRGTDDKWEAARKLTLDAFALPLVVLLTGIGLARSGWRDIRWMRRDDRLRTLAGLNPPPGGGLASGPHGPSARGSSATGPL